MGLKLFLESFTAVVLHGLPDVLGSSNLIISDADFNTYFYYKVTYIYENIKLSVSLFIAPRQL